MHRPMPVVPLESLEELFEEACALPSRERAVFLESCTEDRGVREELASLLAAVGRAEPFFQALGDVVSSPGAWIGEEWITDVRADLEPGRKVAQYRIDQKLGAGGMGVVYRAKDTRLGRDVALKFLPPHLSADEAAKGRFLAEARAAAALDHPNVCAIHEIGETSAGDLFIAMPFYDGETVGEKIARGPLEVAEALDLARQTARGLAVAHAAGLVHQDVKPANLIVTADGTVKILDFGIAKSLEAAVSSSAPRMGTPAYMSPEQAHGDELGPAADLWSLGVVLYEMLTGRRPFRGETVSAVLDAIRNAEPEPPTGLREDLHPEVEAAVLRLLSRDAEARAGGARGLEKSAVDRAALGGAGTSPGFPHARIASGTLGLMVLAAIGATGYLVVADRSEPVAAAAAATELAAPAPRVAVLPFENASGAGERNASLADGLHREMLRLLSTLGLRVTAPTSVMAYRGSDASIHEIAGTLGVGHVVSTRVARSGERVGIEARLIEAETGETRWTRSYSDSLSVSNLRAIQIDMARSIAGALEREAPPTDWKTLGSEWTDDLEAYELYLRGVTALRHGGSVLLRSQLELAIGMLDRAVARDPGFVAARVALASAQIFLHYLGGDRSGRLMAEAKRLLDEVLREHPDLAVAHNGLGHYYYHTGDYARALLAWLRSEELAPGQLGLEGRLATVYRRQGRWEEARAYGERARELDPLNPGVHLQLAVTYHYLRRYEEAGTAAKRSLELEPASPHALAYAARAAIEAEGPDAARAILRGAPSEVATDAGVLGLLLRLDGWAGEHRSALRRTDSVVDAVPIGAAGIIPFGLWRARSWMALGDSVAARAELERSTELLERLLDEKPDDHRVHGAIGMVYAALGREEEAIAAARQGVELLPVEKDGFFGPLRVYELALVYAWTGHLDEAAERLEFLLSIPSSTTRTWLLHDPAWDPLRGHPRFEALLAAETSG